MRGRKRERIGNLWKEEKMNMGIVGAKNERLRQKGKREKERKVKLHKKAEG